MKINKIFSLDQEVVFLLRREENASQLVETLLLRHYKSFDNLDDATKQKLFQIGQVKQKALEEIQKIEPNADIKLVLNDS